MERAMAAAPDTERSFRTLATAGYFAAFVALGLAYASLGPTLTDLATAVGANLVQISYLFTARGLGYLAGSLVGGRLYDTIRGHPVLAGVLVLTSLLMVVIPLATLLWMLIVMLFLIGLFEGATDVGGNTLLLWVHGSKVAPYMNALHFFFGVGAFISPIIIAQVVLLGGGMRESYWILALLALPIAAFLLRLGSPLAPGSSEASSPESAGAGAASSQAPVATALGRDPRLVALMAFFFFLYVGAESGFGGWIATYALATGLGDAATAAYLTSAYWGALTLGRLVSIPIAAHFTPRQVLLGDLIGCLVSVGILLLWPGVSLVTWIGTLGAGLTMASLFPTAMSLAEQHLTISGTVVSLFFVGGSLGGMTVPWLIGQFFEGVGPQVTTVAIMGAVALNLAVFGLIVLHTRRAKGETIRG
jgi:MFS transporter, FHS family, Na+ dependent glucose transporter 1